MKNYKRKLIYILTFFLLSIYSSSSIEYDEYFQLNAQYNSGKVHLTWVMYEFDYTKADLYVTGKLINSTLIDLGSLETKIDIKSKISDSTFSNNNGRKVKIYTATVDYDMVANEETVLLNLQTKQYNFLSIATKIKKNNGNPNLPNIVFKNTPPQDPLISLGATLKHDFDAETKDGKGDVKFEIYGSSSSNSNLDISNLATIDESTGEFEFEGAYSGRYTFTIQAYVMAQGAKQTARQTFVCQVDTCEVSSKVNVTLVNQNEEKVKNADLFLISKGKSNMETEVFVGKTDENGFASIKATMGVYNLLYYQKNGTGVEQFYNNALRAEDATEIAINDCSVVKELTFKVKTGLDSNNLFGLKFVEFPSNNQTRLKLGQEFSYKIKAKLEGKPNAQIRYKLEGSDPSMKIHSETGVLTWTPMTRGTFYAVIIAEVIGEDLVLPIQRTIAFNVEDCITPSTIVVDFKDKNGERLSNDFKGTAKLFAINEKDPNNSNLYLRINIFKSQKINYSSAYFVAGEGEYYLLVESNNNFYWYNDAKDLESAEIIKTECGDTLMLTMIIDEEKIKEEQVKVSGYCLDKNGNPVQSKIMFEGGRANSLGMKEHIQVATQNNGNGYYSVDLPKNFNFIAYAVSENSNRPLYYDQTYNRFEAEYIFTNENKENINFVFGEYKDTTETKKYVKVSGSVVSSANAVLENTFIVALRTDDDTKPRTNSGITYLSLDGSFEFELETGNYVFLAIPQSNDCIPGFYNENGVSSMIWEEASVVNLNNVNSIEINIILQKLERKPGIARVNGKVNSESKVKIDNANILLIDSETAVEYTITNVNGEFDISNVADGEYTLVVNKVGYKSFETNVELDSQEPLTMDIELQAVQGTLDIDNDFEYANINIFPNPSSDYIQIENNANISFNEYEIIGLNGDSIFKGEFSNNMQINLNSLSNGRYYIKLMNESNSIVSSFTVVR